MRFGSDMRSFLGRQVTLLNNKILNSHLSRIGWLERALAKCVMLA